MAAALHRGARGEARGRYTEPPTVNLMRPNMPASCRCAKPPLAAATRSERFAGLYVAIRPLRICGSAGSARAPEERHQHRCNPEGDLPPGS